MPKRCSCCEHPQRVALDFALLQGEPTRLVSERFDGLSYPQVKGHRRSAHHLQRTPRQGITASHTAESMLTRIVECLDDHEAMRALRLAVFLLPTGDRLILIAELRRRAAGRGKVAEPVEVAA